LTHHVLYFTVFPLSILHNSPSFAYFYSHYLELGNRFVPCGPDKGRFLPSLTCMTEQHPSSWSPSLKPDQISTLSDRLPYLQTIPRARMSHRPDNEGSKHNWNVVKLLPDYAALQAPQNSHLWDRPTSQIPRPSPWQHEKIHSLAKCFLHVFGNISVCQIQHSKRLLSYLKTTDDRDFAMFKIFFKTFNDRRVKSKKKKLVIQYHSQNHLEKKDLDGNFVPDLLLYANCESSWRLLIPQHAFQSCGVFLYGRN
jgi:hypothetical protein